MEFLRYKTETIQHIIDANKIAIYGAGTMGRAVRKCLTEAPYNLSVECFIVRSLDDNADNVDGLPVISITDASRYRDSTVLIALNGKFIPEVMSDLTEAGFTDLVPISFDGDEWTAIRGNWMKCSGILPANCRFLSDISANDSSYATADRVAERIHIYVAHSVYDRNLSEHPSDQPYEISIQVGAALTDQIMFAIRDSLGEDNISEKNRQYCELTGIYWAWKNDTVDYIGFSHYRRRFVLSDGQISTILSGDVDVAVTEPIVNFATVKGQYAKDHIAKDWGIFMSVIAELFPEYLPAAGLVQDSICYYAYNMFIMTKDVFNKYCYFIFPILKRCEELIGSKENVYQNRYIGFLAERLLSIFLAKNAEYTVAIADKHFIE